MNTYLFIGGPWDGQKREVADTLPDFKVTVDKWLRKVTYHYQAIQLKPEGRPGHTVLYIEDSLTVDAALQRLIGAYEIKQANSR